MRRLACSTVVALGALGVLAVATPALAFYALTSTPSTTKHQVATLTAVQGLASTATVVEHTGVVDLRWTAPAAPAGATGLRYTVQRGTTVVCAATTETTCRDTGRPTGSAQSYTVVPLLGQWTGPAATTTATVPQDRRLLATVPATATAGTPTTVTLVALQGTAPDTAAVGTRTYTVTGPGTIGTSTPTRTVTVTLTTRPDGSVSGTAPVTLVKAETTVLTLTDAAEPTRSATTGQVVVTPGSGTTLIVDCTGRGNNYSCATSAGTQLQGQEFTAVVTREQVDALGNPLPLTAIDVAITHTSTSGPTVTPTVTFAAGATRSTPISYTAPRQSSAVVTVTATPASGWTASTVQLRE